MQRHELFVWWKAELRREMPGHRGTLLTMLAGALAEEGVRNWNHMVELGRWHIRRVPCIGDLSIRSLDAILYRQGFDVVMNEWVKLDSTGSGSINPVTQIERLVDTMFSQARRAVDESLASELSDTLTLWGLAQRDGWSNKFFDAIWAGMLSRGHKPIWWLYVTAAAVRAGNLELLATVHVNEERLNIVLGGLNEDPFQNNGFNLAYGSTKDDAVSVMLDMVSIDEKDGV